jgi:hypothetical protein
LEFVITSAAIAMHMITIQQAALLLSPVAGAAVVFAGSVAAGVAAAA